MKSIFNVLIALCVFQVHLKAQFIPADGSILHQTQILFSYPLTKGACYYRVQVVLNEGGNKRDRRILIDQVDSSSVAIIHHLLPGSSYLWHVLAFDASGTLLAESENHSFTIAPSPWSGNPSFRARIIKNNSLKNSGGLVALDYMRATIDRNGSPVWFLPDSNPEIKAAPSIRDLRITREGTVTFLTDRNIYECSLDGRILWKGPNDGQVSGDTAEFYHHCFTKLENRNYMVLGSRFHFVKIPYLLDSAGYSKYPAFKMVDGAAYCKVEFGTIIEYDASGKVLWSWDAQQYLSMADLFYRKDESAVPNVSAHLNSFDVDEKSGIIYAGFRNLNRVIIIDKKTGDVLNSIGAQMPSGEAKSGDGFFVQQHDSKLLTNGNLAVFNNDSVSNKNIVSSIVMFSQPKSRTEPSKIVWKFNCDFDTLTNGKSPKFGNITSLPNGHYLVCMGSLGRLIEIDDNKNIYWDCFTENSNDGKTWQSFAEYRCNYTSSLYPSYFSVENMLQSDTVPGKKKTGGTLHFKIVNEGSEPDSYTIALKDDKNTMLEKTQTDTLAPGKSQHVFLTMNKGKLSEKVTVLINSTGNKKLSRQLDYVISGATF